MDDRRPGRAAIANPSYLNCSVRHGTPIFTRAQAQAFDDSAISAGVSGLVLMENAGRGAADVLEQDCSDFLCRPVILGGPGKNGGDAWVVARHLRVRGYVPFCIFAGESEHLQGDALANWNALEAMQIPRLHLPRQSSFDEATSELKRASILVDGLFGTGLARPIDGTFRHLIEQSNRLGIPALSLDCPSGIDCDTGQVWGTAFRASVTVTFGALKRGLLQHPGAAHAGRIRVLDIGVPSPANADSCVRIEAAQVAQNLPCRAKDSHKGSAGRVAVLGGSAGKTGAAYLSGLGALRAGAGLVTLVGTEDVARRWEAKVVELMTESVGAELSVDAAHRCIDGMDAVVLGPGLGISKSTTGFVRRLSKEVSMPMVLDADALTALAKEKCLDELADHPGPRVLTPHPGEAARLLDCTTEAIQRDRYRAALQLSDRSGQTVVLKGAGSIVAGTSKLAVCDRGTPALGVAGTGDVLAGAIASLLAQKKSFEAALAMVWLHAVAGERAARSDRGLLATEVARALPEVHASLMDLMSGPAGFDVRPGSAFRMTVNSSPA